MKTWRGACHCGQIRFEADGELDGVEVCNCSICLRKGYVHWHVPPERFRLLTPDAEITTYRFNTGRAKHHFCPTCGVSPFYISRSDPGKIDVNVRCLEGMTLERIEQLAPSLFDGVHWEASYARNRPGADPEEG